MPRRQPGCCLLKLRPHGGGCRCQKRSTGARVVRKTGKNAGRNFPHPHRDDALRGLSLLPSGFRCFQHRQARTRHRCEIHPAPVSWMRAAGFPPPATETSDVTFRLARKTPRLRSNWRWNTSGELNQHRTESFVKRVTGGFIRSRSRRWWGGVKKAAKKCPMESARISTASMGRLRAQHRAPE